MLQESEIHFEVLQEYSPGARERIVLGNVKLNLAEFCVEGGEEREGSGEGEGGEGVVRRYLMQESKINSTLKASHASFLHGEVGERIADGVNRLGSTCGKLRARETLSPHHSRLPLYLEVSQES